MLGENELLFFIHIPKTAGYTLGHNILQVEYPRKHLYLSDQPKQLKEALRRNNYQVFTIHRYYSEIVDLITDLKINRKISYITMLRHPVDRLISAYFYRKRRAIHLKQDSPALKYSLLDYLKSGERSPLLDINNLQTKYLSGSDNLDLAKENLKHKFKAFGITKRFEDSCLLMKQALGWSGSGIDYKQKDNTSPRPKIEPQVMNEVIEVIEAANQLDVQLYNYAVELFNQRFNALLKNFRTPHYPQRYYRLHANLRKRQKFIFRRLSYKYALLKRRYAKHRYWSVRTLSPIKDYYQRRQNRHGKII